jgi:thiamine-monophosphate kinase
VIGSAARPGEFALIARHFRPLATHPGALALRDDAAMLAPAPGEALVLTVDMIAEGVHFFADDPPEAIAAKALRVNLSDLAAKGAAPLAYLLALGLRADWHEEWVAAFAAGLGRDQAAYGIAMLGGDTVKAAGGTTVSITAIGSLPPGTMVHRAGARPGDIVFVSGTIGDAALGLRLRLGTLDGAPAGPGADHLLDRYLHPRPRLSLAAAIRHHASAAMDVSDGLLGDLGHICEESGVGAVVEAAAVPLSAPAAALATANATALVTALTGGDDYEILATVPPAAAAAFAAEAEAAGVPVARIGRIVEGGGPPRVLGPDGRPLALAGSFDHFAAG